MSNFLYNMGTAYLSNSEFYRHQRVREASFSHSDVEEVLILIARNDLVAELKQYIRNGLKKDFRFTQGNFLIHTMAQYNALQCVKYLVEEGVNFNKLSTYGSTPMENALVAGAEETAEYLKSIGAKSDVVTLRDMIERSNIPADDLVYISEAIEFNDELTDIIVNLSAFMNKKLLAELRHSKLDELFYMGMSAVLQDHIRKLEHLKQTHKEMHYHLINNALLKYDLTMQQAYIFRQLYLNQDLIDHLTEIAEGLNEDADVQWMSEKNSYLRGLLW